MVGKHFPWKGNFLKVPPRVRGELDNIRGDLVAIAAIKSISVADIKAGLYAHLGLDFLDGSVTADGAKPPVEEAGK